MKIGSCSYFYVRLPSTHTLTKCKSPTACAGASIPASPGCAKMMIFCSLRTARAEIPLRRGEHNARPSMVQGPPRQPPGLCQAAREPPWPHARHWHRPDPNGAKWALTLKALSWDRERAGREGGRSRGLPGSEAPNHTHPVPLRPRAGSTRALPAPGSKARALPPATTTSAPANLRNKRALVSSRFDHIRGACGDAVDLVAVISDIRVASARCEEHWL